MKWLLANGEQRFALTLPDQIVDDVELPAHIDGKPVLVRWHSALQTLYIRDPESRLERCLRVRFTGPREPSPTGQGFNLRIEPGGWGERPLQTTINSAALVGGKARGEAKPQACVVRSPLTGKVLQVLKTPGQRVTINEPIAVIEAMKMENKICAPRAGTIHKISMVTNAVVQVGSELAVIH